MKKYLILIVFFLFAIFFLLKAISANAASCPSVPVGGDYTVATSCTFAYNVDGVDNGNLTIDSGVTLTINAGYTVVWNPGKSVIVNGSIAINKGSPGGQLRKGYIYAADIDSDGYYAGFVFRVTDTSPGGLSTRRKNLASWPSSFDCDDSTSTKYQNLSCYKDNDGDGVVGSSAYTVCCGSSCGSGCTGYTGTPGTDCLDSNANIYQNIASLVTDADHEGYSVGTAATQCVGTTTTIGGRTYYNDTSNNYSWLPFGSSLGTDIDDNNACADTTTHLCGNADNTAGTCTAKTAGEQGLAACKRCDGTSIDVVNLTSYAEDSEGSNLCNATCNGCSAGSCIAFNNYTDTYGANTCSVGNYTCCTGICKNCVGAPACTGCIE